ncbi:MAG: hypothetical protein ACYCZZ_01180 [Minisyncoccota bacterium]
MTKLSDVIFDLERDVRERECRSINGTPMSSMNDDTTEGTIAKVIRDIIKELKQVDSV